MPRAQEEAWQEGDLASRLETSPIGAAAWTVAQPLGQWAPTGSLPIAPCYSAFYVTTPSFHRV
jgi:hypothetical protein